MIPVPSGSRCLVSRPAGEAPLYLHLTPPLRQRRCQTTAARALRTVYIKRTLHRLHIYLRALEFPVPSCIPLTRSHASASYFTRFYCLASNIAPREGLDLICRGPLEFSPSCLLVFWARRSDAWPPLASCMHRRAQYVGNNQTKQLGYSRVLQRPGQSEGSCRV